MRLLLVSALLCLVLVTKADAGEPFAVVEMFGSEGCSSCPPADDLLRKLTQVAREQGQRIFTLSFHVDYWNDLGWVDPYSKAQFTERQYGYARTLGLRSVYTPQMIVNGTAAFVGSDEEKAKQEIDQALRVSPANRISLKIKKSDAGPLELVYNCEQLTDQAVLNFALVERGLESKVTAGENAGKTLKHDNVVRDFQSVAFTQTEGTISFARPVDQDLSRFSVVAYVQNAQSLKIVAADSVDLH